jgi:hypothetical protein
MGMKTYVRRKICLPSMGLHIGTAQSESVFSQDINDTDVTIVTGGSGTPQDSNAVDVTIGTGGEGEGGSPQTVTTSMPQLAHEGEEFPKTVTTSMPSLAQEGSECPQTRLSEECSHYRLSFLCGCMRRHDGSSAQPTKMRRATNQQLLTRVEDTMNLSFEPPLCNNLQLQEVVLLEQSIQLF